MAKAKFERSKPHVNVGTIGHVDHGKTTLTAAVATVAAITSGGEAKDYASIDSAQKKKHVASPSTPHTQNMTPHHVTTHTSIAQVTPIMLKT